MTQKSQTQTAEKDVKELEERFSGWVQTTAEIRTYGTDNDTIQVHNDCSHSQIVAIQEKGYKLFSTFNDMLVFKKE